MKKFGFKAASIIAIGALASCGGGWSSSLAGTNWTSTTITPDQTSRGVTMSTFVIHFAAATTSTPTTYNAVGPFTATLTQVYGATASSHAGCTEVTTFATATYSDTGSMTDPTMGGVSLSGETSTTARTGCTATTDNVTAETGNYNDNGGTESYTITGTMMTMTGNSLVPFYPATYTFTKTAM